MVVKKKKDLPSPFGAAAPPFLSASKKKKKKKIPPPPFPRGFKKKKKKNPRPPYLKFRKKKPEKLTINFTRPYIFPATSGLLTILLIDYEIPMRYCSIKMIYYTKTALSLHTR